MKRKDKMRKRALEWSMEHPEDPPVTLEEIMAARQLIIATDNVIQDRQKEEGNG